MANDLVADPAVLDGFPGGPFTQAEVDAAVADVRSAAGWHIAPERAETITLDVTWGERWLRLPTLRLVSVEEIRRTDTAEIIDATVYEVSRALAQVRRRGFWPSGYEAVEVDMTHGYTETPPELLAVVAEAAHLGRKDQTIRQLSLGDYSESVSGGSAQDELTTSAVLARYSLTHTGLTHTGLA
ncbi:MAG: hypothetical protein GEU78_16570 [Actinobacteria bacterium]|nr:hypothetical protein [Actinomycetota bacterium]